jgi:hypothetical protein
MARRVRMLIGLESKNDKVDSRLKNDPRFLRWVEKARKSRPAGTGIRLENVDLRRGARVIR